MKKLYFISVLLASFLFQILPVSATSLKDSLATLTTEQKKVYDREVRLLKKQIGGKTPQQVEKILIKYGRVQEKKLFSDLNRKYPNEIDKLLHIQKRDSLSNVRIQQIQSDIVGYRTAYLLSMFTFISRAIDYKQLVSDFENKLDYLSVTIGPHKKIGFPGGAPISKAELMKILPEEDYGERNQIDHYYEEGTEDLLLYPENIFLGEKRSLTLLSDVGNPGIGCKYMKNNLPPVGYGDGTYASPPIIKSTILGSVADGKFYSFSMKDSQNPFLLEWDITEPWIGQSPLSKSQVYKVHNLTPVSQFREVLPSNTLLGPSIGFVQLVKDENSLPNLIFCQWVPAG